MRVKTLNQHPHDEQFLLDFAAAHPEPKPRDPDHNEVFGPYAFAGKHFYRRYIAAIPRWSILAATGQADEKAPFDTADAQDSKSFDAISRLPSPDLPESTKYPQYGDPFYYGEKVFTWRYEPHDRSWTLMYQLS